MPKLSCFLVNSSCKAKQGEAEEEKMAGVIASSIIKWTASTLSSFIAAPSQAHVPNDAMQYLRRLEGTVRRIQAVLDDLNAREIREELEKVFLEQLRDIAYDAEDVVSEYDYEVLRSKVEARRNLISSGSHKRKREEEEVHDSVPYPLTIHVPDELALRVEDIEERFGAMMADREALRLTEYDGQLHLDQSMPIRRESASMVQERIFGRKKDKDDIISKLFLDGSSSPNAVSVLPIVGMGGIGKTTLAQLIYNDHRVRQYCNVRGWVYVSEHFDIAAVTRKIITCFTKKNCELTELDSLQSALVEEVRGKRFLLVLDDVWNETPNLWDSMSAPLTSAEFGRIIVTSRSDFVARSMRAMPPYVLSCLPSDDCWSLFKHAAFVSDKTAEDGKLLEIGAKIVDKCDGLPLAVKALGSALRFEADDRKWKEVLDSAVWDMGTRGDEILPALRLSYDRMPIHLKCCFLFLTLFPKVRIFEKDHVIRLWMSLGLVYSEGEKPAKDVGGEYFDELQQRTMIQRAPSKMNKVVHQGFLMHDRVHDLVENVAGEVFMRAGADIVRNITADIRYTTVALKNLEESVDLTPLGESRGLRILSITNEVGKWEASNIRITIPDQLFQILKYLRALDLSETNLDILPDSVGHLKQLRYLKISGLYIRTLPASVCNLYNLQILDLTSCSFLQELPEGIHNLVTLQHLFTFTGFDRYICMPRGVGRLRCLQTLRQLNVGAGTWHCGLGELKDLVNLQELSIYGLRKVVHVHEAKEANLRNKRHLEFLALQWNGGPSDNCRHITQLNTEASSSSHEQPADDDGAMDMLSEQILESLEPYTSLKRLYMEGYPGSQYPRWLGDGSLSGLTVVHLSSVKNCESLPMLGLLPSLAFLQIGSFDGVQRVGREFCAPDVSIKAFQSLDVLGFSFMRNLVKWSGVVDGDFPRLRALTLTECPELKMFPVSLCSSLTDLALEYCSEITTLPPLPSLTRLCLEDACEDLFDHLNLPSLKSLRVSRSRDITRIPLGYQSLPCLEILVFKGCKNLEEVDGLGALASLKQLDIVWCRKLQLATGKQFPPSLQRLKVVKCPGLEEWQQQFQIIRNKNMELRELNEEEIYGDPLESPISSSDEEFADSSGMSDDAESDCGEFSGWMDISEEDCDEEEQLSSAEDSEDDTNEGEQ